MTELLHRGDAALEYELRLLIEEYWAKVDRRAGTRRNFDEFFCDHSTMRLGTLDLAGRDRIIGFLREREQQMLAQRRTTRHVVSNYRIEKDKADSAVVRATLQVYSGTGDIPLPAAAPAGIGDFEFHCLRVADKGWVFSRIDGESIFAGSSAPAFAKGGSALQAGTGIAFSACVPHAPMLKLQAREHNKDFWATYDRLINEFTKFDPELVIVFGGDHINTMHLSLMPSFVIGQAAEAIDDWGGTPGALDVPGELAIDLAEHLMRAEYDIATSYAMKLDHGFSAVLETFLRGKLDVVPVIPVFINSHFRPQPSLKRCRELGVAVGEWAGTLGKRVAFLGSGGLSHDVSSIFPQYEDAPNDEMRALMVHGHEKLGLDLTASLTGIREIMEGHANELLKGGESPVGVNPEWDREFLDAFGGDLQAFDAWTDEKVVAGGGTGAREIRMWIAAGAAGLAAGSGQIEIDFSTAYSTLGLGLGLAHAGTGTR